LGNKFFFLGGIVVLMVSKVVTSFDRVIKVPSEGIISFNEKPGVLQKYDKEIDRILISKECIKRRLEAMAKQIGDELKEFKEINCLVVLKGSVFFASDLIRFLDEGTSIRTKLDFIQCASYGSKAFPDEEVIIRKYGELEGEVILVIEDIVDQGGTLRKLQDYLKKKKKPFRTCVLLDKTQGEQPDLKLNYIGFEIPREFVGGYGLDYAGMYRGLSDIVVVKEDLLKKK